MRSIYLVDLYTLNLGKLLDAALHLYRFGGLVTETLYKLLGVGNLLLLIAISPHLLLDTLFAKLYELGVIYIIVINLAAGDFDSAVCYIIDKSAVVTDEHHSFRLGGEKALEPLNGFDVEVVGRFVEQEHIGALKQQFGKLNSHTPSTAELRGGPVEVLSDEAEAKQGALHVGFEIVGSGHCHVFRKGAHLFDKRVVLVTVIIGA